MQFPRLGVPGEKAIAKDIVKQTDKPVHIYIDFELNVFSETPKIILNVTPHPFRLD